VLHKCYTFGARQGDTLEENMAFYLVKRKKSLALYFKLRVPDDLREVVGRDELFWSLGTRDVLEAKFRANVLAQKVKGVFHALKEGDMDLTKEQIDRLLKKHLREVLDESERDRVMSSRPLSAADLYDHLEVLSLIASQTREELARNEYSRIGRYVDDLLAENGVEGVDRKSETYKTLCRELLKVHVKALEVEEKRAVGDYSGEAEVDLPAPAVQETAEEGETLSKIIDLYVTEGRRAERWLPKTEHQVISSLQLLQEVIRDLPVSQIDHAVLREYKETLLALPPNIRKSPAYRDLSIPDILTLKPEKTMSLITVNNQLTRASALFGWAVKNGFMDRNPAERMQVPARKRPDMQREVFTTKDLKTIFHSREYVEDRHRHSYAFWVPIIALFSGMRLEEICQLHLSDIHKAEGGTWVFDINKRDEKKVKTQFSERLVPVHDFLINELGLLDWVFHLKAQGHRRLFPELTHRREGYGTAVSRWFQRFRERVGLTGKTGKKDFHSFRHTFIDNLKQAQADMTLVGELVGHASGSITWSRYGKPYRAKTLKEEVIDRVRYELDLSHLTRSKFSGR
jgi:integrase